MLRHDGKVGVVFTRDENADTYRYLRRSAERIIATPEDQAEEVLNEECKWCIKKTTCKTLASANAGGTVFGLSLEELAKKKMDISNQLTALKYANDEIDKMLVTEAEQRDELEFQLDNGLEVVIGSRPTRKVNGNAIVHIVGEDLAAKYGNFTVTNVDKMLKSGELTPDQEAQVKAHITRSWSEPSAKVKERKSFS